MSDKPNILFFLPDQHRGDWLGVLNTLGVSTPNIDALIGNGLHFTHALTPSPLCSPARACLASGRRYDRQTVKDNRDDFKTSDWNIYRAMRDAGYTVMGCGKFDLLKGSMDWGQDGMHGAGDASRARQLGFSAGCDSAGKHDCIVAYKLERGPEPYRSYLQSLGLWEQHVEDFEGRNGSAMYTNVSPTPLPDYAYCDNWIGDNAVRLLSEAPADKPWFLQVNFNGPHEPLDITEGMLERWRDRDMQAPVENTQFEPALHQSMRRNYAAMIENIDRMVGEILAWLESKEQRDNTVVFYSSDHGENLGDHNQWGKTTPQEASIRVPLVIDAPGDRAERFDKPVDLVDVAATLLELSGAANPGVDGLSLLGDLSAREVLTTGLMEWRSVTDGRIKYVHNYDPAVKGIDRVKLQWDSSFDRPKMLFDLEADPFECNNLADACSNLCRQYHGMLMDELF